MKKLLLILLCLPIIGFGQSDKKIQKTYGGMPTANENMSWEENITPNEKYIGVFQIDSTISASEVIEAFMITFQPLQDANIMTKQMRNNNAFGSVASALIFSQKMIDFQFTKNGDADSRRQNQALSSWTVQFIDGVRISRFYYNFSVQVRSGRYKLTVESNGQCFPNHSDDKFFPFCLPWLHDKTTNIEDAFYKHIECKKYYKPLRDTFNSNLVYDRIICYPVHGEVNEL